LKANTRQLFLGLKANIEDKIIFIIKFYFT